MAGLLNTVAVLQNLHQCCVTAGSVAKPAASTLKQRCEGLARAVLETYDPELLNVVPLYFAM